MNTKKGIKQAVILAGGLGTRMRPLTLTTPKPMVRIHGKPFLEYIVESLVQNGITEIVMLVGYKSEQIKTYFKDGKNFNVKITYSDSGVEANTGARLKDAKSLLDDIFLLLYGDNYWPLKLNELVSFLESKKTEALVTIYDNRDNYTKNNIFVNANGIVEVYDKKWETGRELNGVDIGFLIIQKKHIDLFTEDSSYESIIFPSLIAKKQLAGFLTPHKYYGLSNPDRIKNIEEYFRPKRVVFVDRDGVINQKAPKAEYIKSWKEFAFLPKAVEALQLLTKKNYEIYIITNQAGIARGMMSRQQVDTIHKNLVASLNKSNVTINGIYICPHGWDEDCFCRKPKPGMFFQAASDHAIELYESICIGDDIRDREAALAAGCKEAYLVDSNNHFYDIVRSLP